MGCIGIKEERIRKIELRKVTIYETTHYKLEYKVCYIEI
jgi:hypothetical protein